MRKGLQFSAAAGLLADLAHDAGDVADAYVTLLVQAAGDLARQ